MSKVKLILTSTLLVFAISAIAAASASAETAEFRVGALEKGATEEFAETVEVNTPLLLAAEGETEGKKEKEPTIECTKMKIEKGVIKVDTPEATFKSFDYEGCKDLSEENCKVPSILTKELKDTLEAEGGKEGEKETEEKFEPASGKVIAEFELENKEGKECKASGAHGFKLRIEGDFISKHEDDDKSEAVHNLGFEVKPESGELKYGDQTYGGLFRDDYHWRPRLLLNWYLF